jgi:hypothetical protein
VLLDEIGRAAVEEIEIRELERHTTELAEVLRPGP